jgi:Golgi nucleoside diphosphatase
MPTERKMEFYGFMMFLAQFKRLTNQEMKYLAWRFCSGLTDREIARLDGKRSRQAVNFIIQQAFGKIRSKLQAQKKLKIILYKPAFIVYALSKSKAQKNKRAFDWREAGFR